MTICEPAPIATPHLGGNLFTENFDEALVNVYGAPSGSVASGTIDLVAEGWTGTDHNDNTGNLSEVAMSKMFGPTEATTGNQFLDTQNTPGQINISHTFIDNTAAVNGKTATLSFDIGMFDIDWGGGYQTNANETFEFRIDGQKVAEFTASEFTTLCCITSTSTSAAMPTTPTASTRCRWSIRQTQLPRSVSP